MLLYHGTSFKNWEKIKENGLLPRKLGSKSNWEHTVESDPNTVYLTDAYAMYFSFQCTEKNEETGKLDKAVIIEIDSSLLNQKKFVADEDALEQVSRNTPSGDGLPSNMTIEERTVHYGKMAKRYAEVGYGHEWSLKALGTCGYKDKIPLKAITRVAIIDLTKQQQLSVFFWDPSISILNYRFIGAKYRALNALIFGNEPKSEDMEFLKKLHMSIDVEKFNRDGIIIEEVKPKIAKKPKA
jgi:hypothetical protein